jgi:hypothetical protein
MQTQPLSCTRLELTGQPHCDSDEAPYNEYNEFGQICEVWAFPPAQYESRLHTVQSEGVLKISTSAILNLADASFFTK